MSRLGDIWKWWLLLGFKSSHTCGPYTFGWVHARAGTKRQSFITIRSLPNSYSNHFLPFNRSFSLCFVKAFCLVLPWVSLLLFFFRLDSCSLHPSTIWRWFLVREMHTTRERRPFVSVFGGWQTAFDRWNNGYLCPDESSTLSIQENLRAFSFVKMLHSSAAVSTLIPACGTDELWITLRHCSLA